MLAGHDFLLDPEIVFLSHGSYGACPRPVFECYQQWQLELEVPVYDWEGHRLLRVSIGPYNDESDLEVLVDALGARGALPDPESRR